MLRFNTFRQGRYLRSKFVEGAYLLSSEASDMELEMLDQMRAEVQAQFGDIALEDAWKVEKLSATQILIKPGKAYFKGLPFSMRSGKDQLVSGTILQLGTVPNGVTIADDANGNGKIITFNDSATTPTNNYRVVITATEQIITNVEDPFLQNNNLTEATAQKIRLIYKINLVPEALQEESPIPYRDETSASLSITNFPNVGGLTSPNFVNGTIVTPTAAGNGELLALTALSGSEGIDGRDLELTVRNDTSIGAGIILPISNGSQQLYYNGKLLDSVGNMFHINAIFGGNTSTELVIRIDKELGQPNPQIINTKPYSLIKRDVYVTDDSNGLPQGKLHWPIATVDFNTSSGITHSSKIVDLRTSILKQQTFQDKIEALTNLRLVGNSKFTWSSTLRKLTSDAQLLLITSGNRYNTVADFTDIRFYENSGLLLDTTLDNSNVLHNNVTINITNVSTNVLTIDPITFSSIKVGNTLTDSANTVVYIIAINEINNTITVNANGIVIGSGFICPDVYYIDYMPKGLDKYLVAYSINNRVYINDNLELENGESIELGDGITDQLLEFIGSTGETDTNPAFVNNYAVTDGDSLVKAISDLSATTEASDVYSGKPTALDTTPAYANAHFITQGEDLTTTIGQLDQKIFDLTPDDIGAANKTLSNLNSTAINQSLTPGINDDINLGAADKIYSNVNSYIERTKNIAIYDLQEADNTGTPRGDIRYSSTTPLANQDEAASNQLTIQANVEASLGVYTRDQVGATDSKFITISTGLTDSGNSGDINIKTGTTVTGTRGNTNITSENIILNPVISTSASNKPIINLPTPTTGNEAVNKDYSDSPVDITFNIVDSVDPTKKIAFNAGGTTGTKTTFAAAQTADRTQTLQDTSDTFVYRDTTDILTNKTLQFLRQSVATDSTTTGTLTTLNSFTTGIVRLTNVSLVSLAGIPAGVSGQSLTIENKTGVTVSIANEDTGATAANRILTGTGGVVQLQNDATFLFTYDSTSSRWMLTGGSGSGSGSGSGINYVTNNNGENGTTGWVTYKDSANGARPISGSGTAGGTINTVFTTVANTSLRGDNVFSITSGSQNPNNAGTGVSYDFTIDSADKAKVLKINFDYIAVASGGVLPFAATRDTDGAFIVYIYDVTNSVLIEPSNIKLFSGSTTIPDRYQGEFQTSPNSTSYRLIIHYAKTLGLEVDQMYFDNVSVGPNQYVYGTPVTDWALYTPTYSGLGTVTNSNVFWRRVGDSVEIEGSFTTGTVAAALAQITMPNGYTADSIKVATIRNVGVLAAGQTTSTIVNKTVIAEQNSNLLSFGFNSTTTPELTRQNGNALFLSNATHTFIAQIPINGLSSSVQTSDQADTRVVDFTGYLAANQAITANVTNIIVTTEKDSHGAYSSGIYTIPVAGDYDINTMFLASGAATVVVYVNGVSDRILNTITGSYEVGHTVIPNLKTGDTLLFRLQQSVTLTGTAVKPYTGYINIKRISGPVAIAATESVNASYFLSASTSFTATVPINYDSKEYDSHSAVTTGAGVWKFTAPVSGLYIITNYANGASNTGFRLFKNGTIYKNIGLLVPGGSLNNSSTSVRLLAGEFIDLRTDSTVNITGGALGTTGAGAHIAIFKVGNF